MQFIPISPIFYPQLVQISIFTNALAILSNFSMQLQQLATIFILICVASQLRTFHFYCQSSYSSQLTNTDNFIANLQHFCKQSLLQTLQFDMMSTKKGQHKQTSQYMLKIQRKQHFGMRHLQENPWFRLHKEY